MNPSLWAVYIRTILASRGAVWTTLKGNASCLIKNQTSQTSKDTIVLDREHEVMINLLPVQSCQMLTSPLTLFGSQKPYGLQVFFFWGEGWEEMHMLPNFRLSWRKAETNDDVTAPGAWYYITLDIILQNSQVCLLAGDSFFFPQKMTAGYSFFSFHILFSILIHRGPWNERKWCIINK